MIDNIREKELKTLVPKSRSKLIYIAFLLFLALFSYFGYLILTEKPPKSEQNFFDSIGVKTEKINRTW